MSLEALVPVAILLLTAATIFFIRGSTHVGLAGLAGLGLAGATVANLRMWGEPILGTDFLFSHGPSRWLGALLTASVGVLLWSDARAPHVFHAPQKDRSRRALTLALLVVAAVLVMMATRRLDVLFLAEETYVWGIYALADDGSLRRGRRRLLEVVLSLVLLLSVLLLAVSAGSIELAVVAAAASEGPGVLVGAAVATLLTIVTARLIGSLPGKLGPGRAFPGESWLVPAGTVALAGVLVNVTPWLDGVQPLERFWTAPLAGLAVLTMGLGCFTALARERLGDLVARSMLVHVGMLLIGIVAGGVEGVASVLSFTLALVVAISGACAIVPRVRVEDVDFGGAANQDKGGFGGAGIVLSIFVASLAGVPLSMGFWAKLEILSAGVIDERFVLLGVASGCGVLLAYGYLRELLRLYRRGRVSFMGGRGAGLVLGASGLVVLLLGIWPAPWMRLVEAAMRRLF